MARQTDGQKCTALIKRVPKKHIAS